LEEGRGTADWSVGLAALRNAFLSTAVVAGKIYCLSECEF